MCKHNYRHSEKFVDVSRGKTFVSAPRGSCVGNEWIWRRRFLEKLRLVIAFFPNTLCINTGTISLTLQVQFDSSCRERLRSCRYTFVLVVAAYYIYSLQTIVLFAVRWCWLKRCLSFVSQPATLSFSVLTLFGLATNNFIHRKTIELHYKQTALCSLYKSSPILGLPIMYRVER